MNGTTERRTERVYIPKPDILDVQERDDTRWIVVRVGDVQKDADGKEFYEVVLNRALFVVSTSALVISGSVGPSNSVPKKYPLSETEPWIP